MTLENELFDIPSEHVQNVYGQFDAYLKKIERTIGVTVVSRDGGVKLIGNEAQVESAKQVLLELLELSRRGNEITRAECELCPVSGYGEEGRGTAGDRQ